MSNKPKKAGRPKGATGRELKQTKSVRVYPSQLGKLPKGITLNKFLDQKLAELPPVGN